MCERTRAWTERQKKTGSGKQSAYLGWQCTCADAEDRAKSGLNSMQRIVGRTLGEHEGLHGSVGQLRRVGMGFRACASGASAKKSVGPF